MSTDHMVMNTPEPGENCSHSFLYELGEPHQWAQESGILQERMLDEPSGLDVVSTTLLSGALCIAYRM